MIKPVSKSPVEKSPSRPRTETLFDQLAVPDDASRGAVLARRLDAEMTQLFDLPGQEPGDLRPTALASPEAAACDLLNQCLADSVDLHLQCKQAQWNMTGANATTLATLFAQSAQEIELFADRLAERIVRLAGVPDGALDAVAERSGLNAYPSAPASEHQHIEAVAKALAIMNASLRVDIASMGSSCDADTRELLGALSASIAGQLQRVEAQQELIKSR